MGEGGLGYLQTAQGILDQWHVMFAVYTIMFFHFGLGSICGSSQSCWDAWMSWIIVGIFGLLSLILIILNLFGVELPEIALLIFYILGAVFTIITACVVFFGGWYQNVAGWCTTISMGIFYIYAAVNSQGGGGK